MLERGAPQVVGNDVIGVAAPDEVRRYVALIGIDEGADDLVLTVQFGDRAEPVLVEEALDRSPVHLLADAPVLAVDPVVDHRAGWQGDVP